MIRQKLHLVGQRFSMLLVLEDVDKRKNGKKLYKCICDCGKETIIMAQSLKSGATKSCGCSRRNPNNTNLQRQCYACKKVFPLTEEFFYVNKNKSLGFFHRCKLCEIKHCTKYRSSVEGRIKLLLLRYDRSDETKGINNDLTYDFVLDLIQLPCHYCGDITMDRGLDAKDSNKGHTKNNVVPCCDYCNTAKWDHFTYEETKIYIGPAIAAIKQERCKSG